MRRRGLDMLLLAAAMGACVTSSSFGQIVGTKHDFSGEAWSLGQICLPCHTPHSSDTSQPEPLWNHDITGATYDLYDSPTLKEQVEQPGPKSIICLSCHDGTVALDSFGSNSGTTFITDRGFLDTDLQDDHPIGVPWSHQYPGLDCAQCHNPYDETWQRPLPFYDGKIECLTCHEPHNAEGTAVGMLRVTPANSDLCQVCHAK